MGAFIKLRKKEIFEGGWGILEFYHGVHTDIKKRILKLAWKAIIINGGNCSKYISLSICVKK